MDLSRPLMVGTKFAHKFGMGQAWKPTRIIFLPTPKNFGREKKQISPNFSQPTINW